MKEKNEQRIMGRSLMGKKIWVQYFTIWLAGLIFMPAAMGNSDNKHRSQRIAIIGGGASGLTAAYLLKKQGYKYVTVFEKKAAVGGVAHSIEVDSKVYDLSTMFVPGGTIAGDGIQPLVKEMIDVSGEKLIPAVEFDTLNRDLGLKKMSEYLQGFEPEELKAQLLRGLNLMTLYASCLADGVSSAECGITLPDDSLENIHAWGARMGIPAFSHLLVFTSDALGAGPASVAKATDALGAGFQWTPVEAVRILSDLGVGVGDLPAGTPPNIVSLIGANQGNGTQRWWFFEKGYQTFWKSLVKKARIRVKLAEPVTGLVVKKFHKHTFWVVTTSKRKYWFDRVIVATTPRSAMHFLPESPQKELLATAMVKAPPNDVFISRVSGVKDAGFPLQAAWWPVEMGLGSLDLVNPEAGGGPIKPFFWQKRHPENVMMIATYTLSNEIPPEASYEVIQQYSVSRLGFSVEQQIAHERFYFPPSPGDRVAWNASWQELQGENGMFFIGEAFTGSGVPAIAVGLSRLMPQFFPDR